jgi:hypothetical protein
MCENGQHCSAIPAHPRYHQVAHREYTRALRDAFWHGVRTRVQRIDNKLIPYSEVRREMEFASHTCRGVAEVELDGIVGSSGRFRDFDVTYLPVRHADDDRWVNVAQAYFEGVVLPPVKLYKVGNDYYVEDGNHRISVARVLGYNAIQARVIEISS